MSPALFDHALVVATTIATTFVAARAMQAQPGHVLAHQEISDTAGGFAGVLDDGDEFGFATAGIGDLDGDGVVDLAVGVPAQGGLDLPWFTIDGGGGTVAADGFELSGTIGQPDSHAPMTNGGLSLVGGFWSGASGEACPEDLDGNGEVDFGDLLLVLAAWGECPVEGACPEDLTGDGAVEFGDLLLVLAAWGSCT